jgi:hypothetical protein
VILSGIDGQNNSSTENASGDKPSAGRSLEATLANRSASALLLRTKHQDSIEKPQEKYSMP